MIPLLAFAALAIVAVYQYRQVERLDRQNLALRLKVKSISNEKRRPLTRTQIIARAQRQTEDKEPPKQEAELQKQKPQAPPIQSLSDQALSAKLDQAMSRRMAMSSRQLQDALELAEEAISREPLYYRAYRAKLILLLTLEGKYGEYVSDSEVDDLLSEMAEFTDEETPDSLMLAFEESKDQTRRQDLEDKILNLENDLALLDIQLSQRLPPEVRERLLLRENNLMNRLAEVRANYEQSGASNSRDEELIEISMKRELAREDYGLVISQANSLLEAFPNSALGYYFLIEALRLDGREDDALNVFSQINLPERQSRELRSRLSRSANHKDFWKNLSY